MITSKLSSKEKRAISLLPDVGADTTRQDADHAAGERLQSRADRREVERIQATSKVVTGVQDALFDVLAVDELGQIELF